ncbi:SDR family NAD(P)-dependent oxidoreductase [Rahnella aquatilis]|nr:SDR family NAD(P)-dependent oxidoreductase [Rahnella aquatilis]
MTIDWSNRRALVTGGSSGIGLAIATALSAAGARVGITGRDRVRLERAQIQAGAAWSLHGDLSSREGRDALVAKVSADEAGLDLLVNNAGLMLQPDLLDGGESLYDLETEIITNLVAPIDLSVRLMPLLRKSNAGSIVMVSSGYALTPADRAPTYSASKAGLHSFTKTLRRLAVPVGVHVLEILPPMVDTRATAGYSGKKVSPEEIAHMTLIGLDNFATEVLPGQVRFLPTMLRLFPKMIEQKVAKS